MEVGGDVGAAGRRRRGVLTSPNPFAALAVIDPVAPEVRSRITTRNPLEVSPSATVNVSPELMNRSLAGSGVNVASVASTGLAGAWETPFLVMKAKFTYSSPVTAAQVGLSCPPVFKFSERLSMLSAAHHFVASQLLPAGHGAASASAPAGVRACPPSRCADAAAPRRQRPASLAGHSTWRVAGSRITGAVPEEVRAGQSRPPDLACTGQMRSSGQFGHAASSSFTASVTLAIRSAASTAAIKVSSCSPCRPVRILANSVSW